jgi:lysine/ornithine N-monooxygenase
MTQRASDHDIAIVGAGPYGLALAAYLRAGGLDAAVLGLPMSFWEHQMPRGMLVRSSWEASSISDPDGRLSLDSYERENGPFSRPLPGAEFARYGRWFQERAVPDVDRRLISVVERNSHGFTLTSEDGESRHARRVVIATGLRPFAYRPAQFEQFSDGLAIHTMNTTEPGRFAGRSVAVIGSGQSAVETAALVSEAGAEVELIARASHIRWLVRGERVRAINRTLRRILYAPTDVGPAGLSRLVALPELFRRLPIRTRERFDYRSVRPAATGWLLPRTKDVTMTFERAVQEARSEGSAVSLSLDDGSRRRVEHVILGTGYVIDVTRLPLLGETIRRELRTYAGYPVLGAGFESSIPGLHFVGSCSAWNFGPIMRFVVGTEFTARAVAKHLATKARTHSTTGVERGAREPALDEVANG